MLKPFILKVSYSMSYKIWICKKAVYKNSCKRLY